MQTVTDKKKGKLIVLVDGPQLMRVVPAETPEQDFEHRAFWIRRDQLQIVPQKKSADELYHEELTFARNYVPTPKFHSEGYVRVSYREDKAALLEAHFESIGQRPPAGIEPIDEHSKGGVTRTWGVTFAARFPLSTPLSFFGDYEPVVKKKHFEIGVTEFCKDCIAGGVPLKFKAAQAAA